MVVLIAIQVLFMMGTWQYSNRYESMKAEPWMRFKSCAIRNPFVGYGKEEKGSKIVW